MRALEELTFRNSVVVLVVLAFRLTLKIAMYAITRLKVWNLPLITNGSEQDDMPDLEDAEEGGEGGEDVEGGESAKKEPDAADAAAVPASSSSAPPKIEEVP